MTGIQFFFFLKSRAGLTRMPRHSWSWRSFPLADLHTPLYSSLFLNILFLPPNLSPWREKMESNVFSQVALLSIVTWCLKKNQERPAHNSLFHYSFTSFIIYHGYIPLPFYVECPLSLLHTISSLLCLIVKCFMRYRNAVFFKAC